ncbi:cation efflux system protein [Pseudomonas aeruginosa]|nr:cation efflux system protein [Pseudomonas aeruginosa]
MPRTCSPTPWPWPSPWPRSTSPRRPTNDRLTYGYHRFEILAAAFNAFLLFGVAFYILYAAYERLNQPAEIQSVGMLVIAVLGLLVNLASMRLLAPAQGNSLNVKGAYLEVWSDMLGSLGVIVAAIVIRFTGWAWVDSLVAVLIGFWVLPRTWILLRESLHVLLEGVPKEIQLAELREALLGIPGVTGLHDLHVWSITSGKISLTSHPGVRPGPGRCRGAAGNGEGAAARPLRDRTQHPATGNLGLRPGRGAAGLLKTVQRKRRPAGSSSVISRLRPWVRLDRWSASLSEPSLIIRRRSLAESAWARASS